MQLMGPTSEDATPPIPDTSPDHPLTTQWSLTQSPARVSRAPLG